MIVDNIFVLIDKENNLRLFCDVKQNTYVKVRHRYSSGNTLRTIEVPQAIQEFKKHVTESYDFVEKDVQITYIIPKGEHFNYFNNLNKNK